jgi:hypothetical protein
LEELGDFFWEQLGGVFLESARRRLSWGSWVTFCLEQLGDVFLVAAVFFGAAGLRFSWSSWVMPFFAQFGCCFFLRQLGDVFLGAAAWRFP